MSLELYVIHDFRIDKLKFDVTYPSLQRYNALVTKWANECRGPKGMKRSQTFICIHYRKSGFTNKYRLN
jgi:hypothetical protein